MDWHQAIENEKQQISTDHFPADSPCETRFFVKLAERPGFGRKSARQRRAKRGLWTPNMLHDWGSLVHSGSQWVTVVTGFILL